MKLNIEIDNITQSQAAAIEDMLALWSELGEQNASRWVAFFANGHEGFAPIIKVEGNFASRYKGDMGQRWGKVAFNNKNNEDEELETVYFIDPHKIHTE
jgi:hypothetical protein